jgi:hypothetical protein
MKECTRCHHNVIDAVLLEDKWYCLKCRYGSQTPTRPNANFAKSSKKPNLAKIERTYEE